MILLLLAVGLVWFVVALVIGVILGRAMSHADTFDRLTRENRR